MKNNKKLELMFMKHYAPNRCLYIKVAKLRTGVGVQRCYTYKIAVSKYQGRCEQRSEVFVKIKKKLGRGGGGGGAGSVGGGQGGCERRIEVFVKIQKKIGGGGSGGGREGSGWEGQGGCDRRIEVFGKIHKKKIRGVGSVFFLGGGVGVGLGFRVDVNEEFEFL